MVLRIEFDPAPKTYRTGEEPDAPTFEYLEQNAGIVEDAGDEADAAPPSEHRRRFNEALWGRVLLGWTGLVDVKGVVVPVEPPLHVVKAAREALGEKATAEDVDARARGVWRYAVLRSLPSRLKGRLQALVQAGEVSGARALGN